MTKYYFINLIKLIGKRKVFGLYYFNCNVPLLKERRSNLSGHQLKYCPICKKKPTDKNLATWIEWEIKEERISKPTGVTSCCVFTYAIPKNEVRRKYLGNHERVIVNEFGKKYTGSDFLNMLKYNCITKK